MQETGAAHDSSNTAAARTRRIYLNIFPISKFIKIKTDSRELRAIPKSGNSPPLWGRGTGSRTPAKAPDTAKRAETTFQPAKTNMRKKNPSGPRKTLLRAHQQLTQGGGKFFRSAYACAHERGAKKCLRNEYDKGSEERIKQFFESAPILLICNNRLFTFPLIRCREFRSNEQKKKDRERVLRKIEN